MVTSSVCSSVRKYCTVTIQLASALHDGGNSRAARLTGNQARLEGRLEETEQKADGKYRRDRHAEGDTKDEGAPQDHTTAENLGDGELAHTLVDDWLAHNDTYPEERGGEGIVLSYGFDVGLPTYMVSFPLHLG